MFWNKKTDKNPLGVPLGDIQAMLAPTTIKTTLKGNALLARHEQYTVRIEVVPPATRESENGPIRAVVRMTTDLQKKLLPMFQGRENSTTAAFNAFAALGALYSEGGTIQLGSRLTIYEEEDSWGGTAPSPPAFYNHCRQRGDSRRDATVDGNRSPTS